MPNITQLIALKEKYGAKNNINTRQLKTLNENFSASAYQIKNSFASAGLDSGILSFFENQESADIILLFIDITSFSTKCKNYTNNQLSIYLDNYYDLVIPLIYANGGEIEKIMGDGIIAIFGQPFLGDNETRLFERADTCAKDIIIKTKGTDKEVKIALHNGSVMYYKNKTIKYPEYTVIGKPLTELYRLESVANNNAISFYYLNKYDNQIFSKDGAYCLSTRSPISCKYFTKSGLVSVSLPGVDSPYIKHLSCTS
ncbi:MAG: cyaE2 [Mucilaginibacter sp.]|nr:cyaE2 [Mucilaginibacter sp.]